MYRRSHLLIGPTIVKIIRLGKMGAFFAEWVRSHVTRRNLESAYARMAHDEEREKEALEWAEATFGDAVMKPGEITRKA